jgi:hypothetical protein
MVMAWAPTPAMKIGQTFTADYKHFHDQLAQKCKEAIRMILIAS